MNVVTLSVISLPSTWLRKHAKIPLSDSFNLNDPYRGLYGGNFRLDDATVMR